MKKILLVNNGYPTREFPQYTTYIKSIEDCLLNCNFDIEICAIKYNKKGIVHKCVKYIKFWTKLLFQNYSKYDYIYINHPPYCLPYFLRTLISKKIRKKTICHWHGNDVAGNGILTKAYKIVAIKTKSRYINIVPSNYFARLLSNTIGINKKDIFISPSGGVDTIMFSPRATNYDSIIIGFSGALTIEKGADILLDVTKRQKYIEDKTKKHISFKVINYGSEARYYIQELNKASDDVDIIDVLEKKRMPNFYNSISLLLFPSRRRGESLGLVALEAMSCNKPVVTFDICAFPEFVIPNTTGEITLYSTDVGKRIDDFIDNIIKVINNYRSYHPRKLVEENYSSKSVSNFYLKLLK